MKTTTRPSGAGKAPPALGPSRPFTVQPLAPPIPEVADPEARRASAARHGHDFGRVSVGGSGSSQPIQMWPDFLSKLWKKKEDPTEGMSDTDRRLYHLSNAINEDEHRERDTHDRWRTNFDPQRVGEAVSTSGAAKAQTALSPLSGALSVGGKAAQTISHTAAATQSASALGMAAPGLSIPASAIDVYQNAENVVHGHDKAKDKALMAAQATSSLGNIGTTAASGMIQGAKLGLSGFKAASGVASAVAGPAAMVTGGVDMVRGTVSGSLALHRRGKLKAMEEQGGNFGGVARYAKQAQTTKAVRGFGTAVGGGLAVAGGLGLLGLLGISNPVGWGLLGGAAAIGGGLAAYKKYRQHQLGKKIRDNHEGFQDQLRAANIRIPTDKDLELKGWKEKAKNLFTTKEARRADMVRGQIAEKLTDTEDSHYAHFHDPQGHVPGILSNIGIKPKPPVWDREESPLLDDEAAEKQAAQKKRRIKDISRVLEG